MPDTANDVHRASYELEVALLKSEVEEMRKDIKDLVEAWNTAKGMTSFVKWLSGVIVAAGTIYAALKGVKV